MLLPTKLYAPSPPPHLVRRKRLVERLNEGLSRKLTLVSAPAGFGKTTLLSEWVAANNGREMPVAWVSLDERDNDQQRFWAYFTAAIETLNQERGAKDLAALGKPDDLPEEMLAALIERVIADLPDDFALVLDDFHLITAPLIHDALVFLLNHLPPQMHLVIVSRVDPSIPISQLRARGQLTEVRTDDLRFTFEEAIALLNHTLGLDLPVESVTTLGDRTEGWIAGLQLAALALQTMPSAQPLPGIPDSQPGRDRPGQAEFIQAFSGVHRYIVDYLAEQVLQQQPAEVQDFLLDTSILDFLGGPVCNNVTGRANSQAMLERLERANLFLVPLDDERRWYRYHRLFADFLKDRLRQTQPERYIGLHQRAAEWCEQNQLLEDAVQHALDGKDFVLAARLMKQVVEQMWGRSKVLTLLRWMKALPQTLVQANPRLCLTLAWAFAINGQLETVEPLIRYVETHLDQVERDEQLSGVQAEILADAGPTTVVELRAAVAVLRVFVARFQGDPLEAVDLGRRALALVPPDNPRQRGIVLVFLGHACFLAGQIEEARQTLEEACSANLASGHLAAYLSAVHYMAQLHVQEGRLRDALAFYQQAQRWVSNHHGPSFAGIDRIGIGGLLTEWNDLDAAAVHLNEGLHLADLGGDFVFLRDGYLAAARLARARGDLERALAFTQKAAEIVYRSRFTRDISVIEAWQARLWVAHGNLASAIHWAMTCGLDVKDEADFLAEFGHLTLARVRIAEFTGRPVGKGLEGVLGLLERILRAAETSGRIGQVIETLALKALALRLLGLQDAALASLERALSLAEPEGYLRIFLDEGEPLRLLIVDLRMKICKEGREGLVPYTERLLESFEGGRKPKAPSRSYRITNHPLSPITDTIDPLSEREVQILNGIARGLSYQEIAEELMIALSTVQWHIKNLYQKLQVHSGLEAVALARKLSLIV